MPVDATLMVTVSVHRDAADGRPCEISRLGYRGDSVQLRFRGTPLTTSRAAVWNFDPEDPRPSAQATADDRPSTACTKVGS